MNVAISGDQLVVAGGRQTAFPNTFGNLVSITSTYNFNNGSWTNKASIPTQRAGTMAVAVADEVLVIGGETAGVSSAQPVVESFNVNSGNWSTLSSLNIGSHGGAAVVLSNTIHVVTGSENLGGAPESTRHETLALTDVCLLYTSPSPRDRQKSRMPSSA